MEYTYKTKVEHLRNFAWSKFGFELTMFANLITGFEFAETFKVTLKEFPKNKGLRQMAVEELMTTNLQYTQLLGEGTFKGDHYQFLEACMAKLGMHFAEKSALMRIANKYLEKVRSLSAQERALTLCSREKELAGVFKQILAALDWDNSPYGFYKYYAEMHIQLDTQDGGHGDLIEGLMQKIFDADVLDRYYQFRLEFILELMDAKMSSVARPEDLMSGEEMLELQNYYDSFADEQSEKVFHIFYQKVITRVPALAELFPHVKAQEGKLRAMVTYAFANLFRWDLVIPEFHALGRFHKQFDLTAAHFDLVGEVLIESLAEVAGPTFAPMQKRFVIAYTAQSGLMQEAMAA